MSLCLRMIAALVMFTVNWGPKYNLSSLSFARLVPQLSQVSPQEWPRPGEIKDVRTTVARLRGSSSSRPVAAARLAWTGGIGRAESGGRCVLLDRKMYLNCLSVAISHPTKVSGYQSIDGTHIRRHVHMVIARTLNLVRLDQGAKC